MKCSVGRLHVRIFSQKPELEIRGDKFGVCLLVAAVGVIFFLNCGKRISLGEKKRPQVRGRCCCRRRRTSCLQITEVPRSTIAEVSRTQLSDILEELEYFWKRQATESCPTEHFTILKALLVCRPTVLN